MLPIQLSITSESIEINRVVKKSYVKYTKSMPFLCSCKTFFLALGGQILNRGRGPTAVKTVGNMLLKLMNN